MAKIIKPRIPMFRLSIGMVIASKFKFRKQELPTLHSAFALGEKAMKGGAREVIIAAH